jgi:hypothetical protein
LRFVTARSLRHLAPGIVLLIFVVLLLAVPKTARPAVMAPAPVAAGYAKLLPRDHRASGAQHAE